MVGRRDIARWLERASAQPAPPPTPLGPETTNLPADDDASSPGERTPNEVPGSSRYPGERLGRPEQGPGSIAGPGRRVTGLMIDWVLALIVARGLLGSAGLGSFGPLLVLLVENALLVGTAGATVGHRLMGLRVETLSGEWPGPVRAGVRAVLLCLAIPPLVWDRDQRGWHDQAAGTVLARR